MSTDDKRIWTQDEYEANLPIGYMGGPIWDCVKQMHVNEFGEPYQFSEQELADMASKVTKADLDHLKRILPKLAEWFDHFGNYTRAGNVDRLLDGIKEYESDILS